MLVAGLATAVVIGVVTGSLRADHSAVEMPGGIACTPWVQINDGAFGLGEGAFSAYNGEEGFEVAVFKGQLYLGMEADSSWGARLWRTRANVSVPLGQSDWEEVIADADGLPWGIANIPQVDHVDSLGVFRDILYVSSANSRPAGGTLLFRSATGAPHSWVQAAPAGFGDRNNINFKDMQNFDGRLCGGTQNWSTGAQVWCTADGELWTQANHGGFGDRARVEVWSGHVYRGALYFGVQDRGASGFTTNDDVAMLFRTTDLDGVPIWRQVFAGPPGSYRVDILGDLYGYLYISHRSPDGIVILRSPSGQVDTWQQVNISGMDGNPRRTGSVVDGATVYGGALYVAVSDMVEGVTIWRTTGAPAGDGVSVTWERVGGSGIVDPNNVFAELIEFNGHLYAWTSNYKTGQQVLRAKCSAVVPAPAPRAGNGLITGRVWYDAADEGYNALPDQGIGGVWLDLTEAGLDASFGTPDDVSYPGAQTGPDGTFTLVNLPAGRFRLDVREDTFPQPFVALTPADGSLREVTLGPGGQAHITFPYVLIASAGLSGYVWNDLNANGWWDSNEPGLPDIAVRLYYAGLDGIFGTIDDFAKQIAHTDARGRYAFTDLPGGRYQVIITPDQLPVGTLPTVDWHDPNQIVLREGQILSSIDFGYAQNANAILEGIIWEDRHRDGMRSPDEPGIPGVEVNLQGAGADGIFGTETDAFYSPTFTDADGVYRFAHLVPGKYMVIVIPYILPPGYSLPSGPYSAPYELAAGQRQTDVDFGLYHDYYDLALAAIGTPAGVTPGQPITYTVTVTNTGTITATYYRLTSAVSACPAGLNQQADVPGWECRAAYEHECLFVHCEMSGASLAPGASVSHTLAVQTLASMPIDVESVLAEVSIAADGTGRQATVITPVLRPPAAIEGRIVVEGASAQSAVQPVVSIFVTATALDSGVQVTAFSDPTGRYRIADLAPGVYRLDVPRDTGPLQYLSHGPLILKLTYGQTLAQDFVYRAVDAPVVKAFWAAKSVKGMHVSWQTSDEREISAYRVWRSAQSTGPFYAVSTPIFPAGANGQALYEWLDPRAGNERWYLLELLPSGQRIGPVSVPVMPQHQFLLPLILGTETSSP